MYATIAKAHRVGRVLPLAWSRRLRRLFPSFEWRGALPALGVFVLLLSASVAVGFTLRDYSLSSITAFYTPEAAVLSPALLRDDELKAAYRTATADARVHKALQAVGPAKSIVYVVPLEWCLPDLPLEATRTCYGHYVPVDFDRRYYKLLFTRARTHAAQASGKNIVKTAYGLHPIVLVKVDISSLEVTGVETPPSHVFWGDIPTPLF